MTTYDRETLPNGAWVIYEHGRVWRKPQPACTFAFDTETRVFLDGEVKTQHDIYLALRDTSTEEKRARLYNEVWAWQIYDEVNGFFMTNNFDVWLYYQCQAKHQFGWCYNATFDFAQIDYKLLAEGADKWTPHVHKTGKSYSKAQRWTYESVHNNMGARYAYKLWVPYRSTKDRHEYVHAVEYRDFMKLMAGGLKRVLLDLDVRNAEGNPIRKLEMDYQAVDVDNPTDDEVAYCRNDVEGLYFAVKQFNATMEAQTNGELHIFGEDTNVLTAGGFAKHELLRSMYPDMDTRKKRMKQYQKDHPITVVQDTWLRDNHLYRGGISYVNPRYRGRLLTREAFDGVPMYRYDVNSEYPFAMANIRDLVGEPKRVPYGEYMAMPNREDFEAILMLTNVSATVNDGMLGVWYDPFKREFVDNVNEHGLHLMFERELTELSYWYDIDYTCDEVILYKRGDYAYRRFVEANYTLKATAKAEGKKAVEKATKLLLNSSYGKLAERLERIVGHYELNEDTGAVHFVPDKTEVDEGGRMSVAVGALVTAYARCYILSKIREVCHGDVAGLFIYIDTDSAHVYAEYDKADPVNLGGLKCEAKCDAVKYIAPKTYVDVEHVGDDGAVDIGDVEVHSKGISTAIVMATLAKAEPLTIDVIDKAVNYGVKYVVLCAMNVRGGKVLVPTEKYLARVELAPDELQLVITSGYDGQYLIEV